MAKRESRAARRERLLRAAAEVSVPASCDVVVIGGGASGLSAAIAAAEAGASIVVLERDLECGRPILATGNGRCNFANTDLDPKRYNNPSFVEAVCGERWLDDVLDFFRRRGMRWCAEDDRLYPISRQAASVRNVLLARARNAGVALAPAREVTALRAHQDGMSTTFHTVGTSEERTIDAAAAIVACGGMAQHPIAGIDLPTSERHPVLCPLACGASPLTVLDGRRVHAEALLTKAGACEPCWQERGEVLFRSYGLSGIVVFDASRRAEAGDLIELDLVPELGKGELRALADPAGTGCFEAGRLDGVLDPAVVSHLELLAHRRWHIDWPGRVIPTCDTEALVSLAKALPFLVEGPADTDHAQVMRGGLETGGFNPTTLASYRHPWLFACGEALDIDADCGGFNLAWAWKSGMVAGKAAARWASHD